MRLQQRFAVSALHLVNSLQTRQLQAGGVEKQQYGLLREQV
jgi:hypothetical protein